MGSRRYSILLRHHQLPGKNLQFRCRVKKTLQQSVVRSKGLKNVVLYFTIVITKLKVVIEEELPVVMYSVQKVTFETYCQDMIKFAKSCLDI